MNRAPDALFDLAVNRAATTLRGVPSSAQDSALQEWHQRTRFARRVPLSDVAGCLEKRPAGEWHWQGGAAGAWRPGKAAFP